MRWNSTKRSAFLAGATYTWCLWTPRKTPWRRCTRRRDAQGSFDLLAVSRLRKQPDNRVEPARAYSKMVSIAARRAGQRAERLAGGVSLKQKVLSLNAQTKGRMTGGLASEVKAVERYLKPAAVPTRKQSA